LQSNRQLGYLENEQMLPKKAFGLALLWKIWVMNPLDRGQQYEATASSFTPK
jgi:hypothetical protein